MRGIRCSQELIDEYVSKGYWSSITFVDIFERNAGEYPDREAVVDPKTRLTWSQVKQFSDRLALNFLDLGIKRDQIIVVQLPNVVEAFVLYLACRKAGIISGLPPMVFRQTEMEYALKQLEAVGVVIPWRYRDFDYFQMIQDIRPSLPNLKYIFVTGDDVPSGAISVSEICQQPLEKKYPADYLEKHKLGAFDISTILVTSGTTGPPKLVECPEAACVAGGKGIIEKMLATGDDIFGGIMPMAQASGFLSLWLAPPQVVAKTVLLDRWDVEEALKLIEKEKITTLCCVPPQIEKILHHPNFDKTVLSSLRAVRSGAGPLKPSLGVEMEQRTRAKMVISSGSSETGVLGSTGVDDPTDVRLYTLGKPITGTELKIVDDAGKEVPRGEAGELWGRGSSSSSGYYKNVEATKQVWGTLGKDGWFHTGDIAMLDQEGNLTLVGRKKDMILRGGQNIFPKEIEDMLRRHPKILDAAVVAMPDPMMGEKACAYVVVKSGQHFSFEEMVSFLKEEKLSTYKLPERLVIVGSFPVVADVQKVDKKALRQDIADKLKGGGEIK